MSKWTIYVLLLILALGLLLLAWHYGVITIYVFVTKVQLWSAMEWFLGILASGLLCYYLGTRKGGPKPNG